MQNQENFFWYMKDMFIFWVHCYVRNCLNEAFLSDIFFHGPSYWKPKFKALKLLSIFFTFIQQSLMTPF